MCYCFVFVFLHKFLFIKFKLHDNLLICFEVIIIMIDLLVLIDLRAECKRTNFTLIVNGINASAITIALHLSDNIRLATVYTLLTIRFFFFIRKNIFSIGIQLLNYQKSKNQNFFSSKSSPNLYQEKQFKTRKTAPKTHLCNIDRLEWFRLTARRDHRLWWHFQFGRRWNGVSAW